ncbi:hypothetical protein AMATHDRAFT_61501 [Amanita thiersii Skay4041]|uniref:SH3 domain-containing protein n=1 Tax=Amanita thiersii Skay4041 TaxID=703135 RepID=A0A2A9NR77_9AGAR|nr:hypothetical protein AMATHDRAFT_61501 [Amanita thiersii Skay4041]
MNEALDEAEKLLPIDALGVVMILHGEEYGDESLLGNSLIKFGRAHCKIATLQQAFALTLKDTFMKFLIRFSEEIKECDSVRKKLEGKRLSYDAAVSKAEKCKGSKKEKDRREAEEELERAQQRYEETMEDIRAHMHAIQENEIAQHRELTAFLDLEINFVQQYLDVLKDVKSDWQLSRPSRRNGARSPARHRQTKYSSSRVPSSIRTNPSSTYDSSEDESESASTRRRSSSYLQKSESTSRPGSVPNSRPNSRPASRLSRKRADSAVTVNERDKDTDKEKADKPKRMSVAGWASSAVGSMASLGRKNKERFTSLQDDADGHFSNEEDPWNPSLCKSSSLRSVEQQPGPHLQRKQRKTVRALRDFIGSADELSFRQGEEVIVLNEVLDEWWLGMIGNRTGLFPTSYVEILSQQESSAHRPRTKEVENEAPQGFQRDSYGIGSSDEDLSRNPLSFHPDAFYTGNSDVMSFSSSANEDEEENLMTRRNKTDEGLRDVGGWGNSSPPPVPMRRSTTGDIHGLMTPTTLKKQTQPPPPPPRRMTPNMPTITPPIPERRPLHGLRATASTSTVESSGDINDRSPFESASELGKGNAGGEPTQNPF